MSEHDPRPPGEPPSAGSGTHLPERTAGKHEQASLSDSKVASETSSSAMDSAVDLRRAMTEALTSDDAVDVLAVTKPQHEVPSPLAPVREEEAFPAVQPDATTSPKAPPSEPDPAASGSKSRSARVKRVAIIMAQLTLALCLLGALAVFFVVRHFEANLPSVEQLRAGYDPPQVTRVLARDGTLLANLFTERRTVVPFSDIPNHVKQAFLAAEDASFYEHEGLDYLGMLRAMLANLRAGRTTQGGSTITQQVIKNVLLDSERSYRRKIRETILARRVEQHLTKDEIFGLYLNHIYLGHGRYGVEEAARYYFAKHVREVDVAEAALLAGLVAAPERYSPRKHPERALERRRYVLGQMLHKGFMTSALHGQASIVPMKIAPAVEAESELCPEVIARVRSILKQVQPDRARRGGYTVHTSIDPGLQTAARKAVRDNLDRYMKRQKLLPPYTLKSRRLWGKLFSGTPRRHKIYVGKVTKTDDAAGTIDVMVGDTLGRVNLKDEERYNPKRLPPSEFVKEGAALRVAALETPGHTPDPIPLKLELGPQSAMVALDVRTREVRALVGSYEAVMGGLDRSGSSASDTSLLAKRQPGSSFKPLMYSYALHSRHVTPASVFEFPAKVDGEETTRRITLREGVAKSDNEVAEAVMKRVGAANVVAWAKAMGVHSALKPDLSLALGSYEVSVFELTNAYATLASAGTFAQPRIVTKIVTADGSELTLPELPPTRRVLSEEEAYLTTSLLRGVVETGTARRARSLERPVAGKTGTTNKNRDAWFVGYSTEYVAGCWTGYDDGLALGWGEYGAVASLPAWIDFMKFAHQGHPRTQFPKPPGIVQAMVDPRTGLMPYPGQEDSVEEEFLSDSLPTETATPPDDETETEEAEAMDPVAPDAGLSAPQGEAEELVEGVPAPDEGEEGDMHDAPMDEALDTGRGTTTGSPGTTGAAPLPDPEPPPF